MKNKEAVKNKAWSFRRGYGKASKNDYLKIRQEIMEALNIKTVVAFYNRLNGRIEPGVTEAETIEAVFAKYGVTDIWGER